MRLGARVPTDYSIENTGSLVEEFNTWVNIEFEDGVPYAENPIVGPIPMGLGPGGEIGGSAPIRIPLDAGAGALDLCLEVGESPEDPRVSACFTITVESPISVSFTTPNPNVRRGQRLNLDYEVANESGSPRIFEIWVENYTVGGEPDPRNPIYGPLSLNLAPGDRLDGARFYPLPLGERLGGPYKLCLSVGTYPNLAWEWSCVEYYIVP